jgi:hypothetical protein
MADGRTPFKATAPAAAQATAEATTAAEAIAAATAESHSHNNRHGHHHNHSQTKLHIITFLMFSLPAPPHSKSAMAGSSLNVSSARSSSESCVAPWSSSDKLPSEVAVAP